MYKNFFFFLTLPVIGFFLSSNIINLYISTGSKEMLIIEFDKNNTVKDLKYYLQNNHNFGEIGDKIFYNNIKLDEDQQLSYYNIKNEDTIEIVLREF